MAHRLPETRMVVVGRLDRRYERELEEVHGVEPGGVDLGQRVGQGLARPRCDSDLVRVVVHEPVGVEGRGELLLAFEDRGQRELAPPRQRLDADQPLPEVGLGEGDRPVSRLVVDQVDVDALPREVLDAAFDETLLVVGSEKRDDPEAGGRVRRRAASCVASRVPLPPMNREGGRGLIVIGGALAAKPGVGGHTWVFLQYLLGFRRLGWDVLFLDSLDPASSLDAGGNQVPLAASVNAAYTASVMRDFGLSDSFALLDTSTGATVGVPRRRLLDALRSSAMLLNVMGYVNDEEVLAAVPRRVYLDIDPGFPQMWLELGLHDAFAGHDAFVTIGENIGTRASSVPTCGLEWVTTPQPVVLELWPPRPGGDRFTSIGTWRGAYGPVEYKGKTHGLRVHEFRKFASVPRRTRERFELALRIDETETSDLELLADGGWTIVDPRSAAGDPAAYRRYIQGSKAEFMVAKNMYVETQSGWFSDRSICYLASGKPVLAQDTGLSGLYPLGEGLATFSTLDEAFAGVAEIVGDYRRHARVARELAVEHFDSDRVLLRLLDRLGFA